jgi:tetratricopeptide (TPR) repeat protein
VNTIISDTKSRIGLARTFIINGIGYDFNQVPWESFERDAEVKGWYVTVLAEANILYSKNEADKQRFLYLRAKLNANLANPQYMYERGLECLNNAVEINKTLVFEDTLYKARNAADYIAGNLAKAVACFNQTYFSSFNWFEVLCTMKCLPDGFIDIYKRIISVKSVDELKKLSHDIILTTRYFFIANDRRIGKGSKNADYQYLADWYQECSYYFRRIYHFCFFIDPALAFSLSSGLQPDLNDLSKDFNISGLDILTWFDDTDLTAFAGQVKLAEDKIVSAINSSNVKIDSYLSVDEFLSRNS